MLLVGQQEGYLVCKNLFRKRLTSWEFQSLNSDTDGKMVYTCISSSASPMLVNFQNVYMKRFVFRLSRCGSCCFNCWVSVSLVKSMILRCEHVRNYSWVSCCFLICSIFMLSIASSALTTHDEWYWSYCGEKTYETRSTETSDHIDYTISRYRSRIPQRRRLRLIDVARRVHHPWLPLSHALP